MRRNEKEIKGLSEIEAVIKQSTVCRIALSEKNIPYIVPVSFGYQDNAIYIHGALEGKKIDILKMNPEVCFEFDVHAQVVKSDNPCNWGIKYQSVIGHGRAQFLEAIEDKRYGLDVIMRQYSSVPAHFPEKAVNATSVIKIQISSMTGKQSGF